MYKIKRIINIKTTSPLDEIIFNIPSTYYISSFLICLHFKKNNGKLDNQIQTKSYEMN